MSCMDGATNTPEGCEGGGMSLVCVDLGDAFVHRAPCTGQRLFFLPPLCRTAGKPPKFTPFRV